MVSPSALNETSSVSLATQMPCNMAFASALSAGGTAFGASAFGCCLHDIAAIKRPIATIIIRHILIRIAFNTLILKLLFAYAMILKLILLEFLNIENVATVYDECPLHSLLDDAPCGKPKLFPLS